MWSARRKFLSRFGGMFLGSAAVLLQPSKLFAGRRGGGCSPCPPVYYSPPLVPCSPALIQTSGFIQVAAGPITLMYPSAGVTTIPGGGDFCTWGGAGAGVTVTDCYMGDSMGNKLATQPAQKTDLRSKMGADWGWSFGQYSNQANFTIVVTFTEGGSNYKFVSPVYNTGSGG